MNVKEGEAVSKPVVGLIVPPLSGAVPPDAEHVYPDIDFRAEGLGLHELSVSGYDSVIAHVTDAALRLRDRGAEAISLMGTSLSLYRGKAFNDEITSAISVATGLPTTTMSTSVIEALRELGVERPAVASAYTEDVHGRLLLFLRQEGFEPVGGSFLSIDTVDAVHEVEEERVLILGAEAIARSDSPDGALISCGGLRTSLAVNHLEAAYGIPVVSSPLAGLWAAARLVDAHNSGMHGSRLFRRSMI